MGKRSYVPYASRSGEPADLPVVIVRDEKQAVRVKAQVLRRQREENGAIFAVFFYIVK